ncbi:nuclear transport factor 2 family protein [Macrococcus lamae]|uniref:Nuclear transport factor 2 family protein n=1 Tax=Macrococcus lamae TaxID=198484 RepID=A0A4R6BTE3_9STAP|nr:nuclear transport factor 2 family protein [Macrococcus lamae]TDM07708.1 nuclear transport factor 2 family protein [Macrococcus lamae]
MTYLHLMMAVQNQNTDELLKLFHEDVELTLVDHDDTSSLGGFEEIRDRIAATFALDCTWDFDVINRVERGKDEIVFIKASREQKSTEQKYVAIWIVTCEKGKIENFIKRFHIEVISLQN